MPMPGELPYYDAVSEVQKRIFKAAGDYLTVMNTICTSLNVFP